MRSAERLGQRMRREEAARGEQDPKAHVRRRIHDAASWFFSRYGTTGIHLEDIAAKAETNTPTVRKYYGSKESLVTDYLRHVPAPGDLWKEAEKRHPGNPRAQIREWIECTCGDIEMAHPGASCRISAAAFEFRRRDHPATAVIRKRKLAERNLLCAACTKANYRDPEALADKLFMLAEGGQVAALTIGADGPAARVRAIADALLAEHAP